jgi:hypothetical protein
MNWKDTVIKYNQVKMKSHKILDDKLNITITLAPLIEGQAKISFLKGLNEMQEYFAGKILNKEQIGIEDFAIFYENCGYPDFAKGLRAINTNSNTSDNDKE